MPACTTEREQHMRKPDILSELEEHGTTAKRATAKRNASIIAAREQGVTLRQIAEAAQITAPAVAKIVNKYKGTVQA